MKRIPHILATAGHVDHGKSALVQALTGIDPDRLPEEKARGITIDLGFANLRLPAPQGELEIGIVDVPGHEDFIKNMIAGASSAQAALLVVAADDGWMPQTQEHLEILLYLGIQHAVVAISKVDAAPPDRARAQIVQRLQATPFASSPIVHTSARTSAGLPELRAALASLFARLPNPGDTDKPRLHIDRAFAIKGAGTVVTGTMVGGRFTRGQHVLVQPAGITAHIRAIQTQKRDTDHACPAMRAALNIPELSPGTTVRRGDTVSIENVGAVSRRWDVHLWRVPSPTPAPPLRNGTVAWLHYGTAAVKARIQLVATPCLQVGQNAIARILFADPIFALAADRFLIRDASARWTLAGGLILDCLPPLKHWRDRVDGYHRRAAAPADPAVWTQTAVAWDAILHRRNLLATTHFSSAQIAAAVQALAAAGQVSIIGDFIADPACWARLQHRACEVIDAFHKEHPQERGIAASALHASLAAPLSKTAFDNLIESLRSAGIVRAGSLIKRQSHHPSLPPEFEFSGRMLRALLDLSQLNPPIRSQLAPDATALAGLRFLIITGELTELSSEIVITTQAYSRAIDTVSNYLKRHGKATVTELKTCLATTRRIAVPLLERLDSIHVTRRIGDYRMLATAKPQANYSQQFACAKRPNA